MASHNGWLQERIINPMQIKSKLLLACSIMFTVGASASVEIMPSFANVPTGWTTDRYAPAAFSNVGTYQGRDNVLGIGISSGDFQANAFYNTQGKGYFYTDAQAQGSGSSLSADLYIPSEWRSSANGTVRSDMWAVGVDASGQVADYAIIGFSNEEGTGLLHFWDDQSGIWTTIATAVGYDAWTSLSIGFDGSAFNFDVNGTQVGSMANAGSTSISEVIMLAKNYGDDYTAHWSNTAAVPEPSTYVSGALLLLPFGVSALRMIRKGRKA